MVFKSLIALGLNSILYFNLPPQQIFWLSSLLNYLPLHLRYPIKPIDNIVYLLIRNRNLPFNLFPFC